MVVTAFWIAGLVALLVVSSVASYFRLLMRRLDRVTALKLFRAEKGRRIQADRERVGVSISALHGAVMATFAVSLTGLFVLRRPEHLWENVTGAVLTVLVAVGIFDQLIPFLLVARHDEPERILEKWIPLLRLSVFLALPLTFPILISTTIARVLEPLEETKEIPAPQDNLQELIEAGEQEGLIGRGEGKLLQALVDFGDKTVREVMTPRPEIAALDVSSPVEEMRRLFREKRQTRYPVYTGELDRIEGIVNVRDLMALPPEEQGKATLRSILRPVLFVPETKRLQELLKELQQTTTQMAIVIDEYGNVSGLVTVEDLVEEIVGEIRDEVEPHAQDVVKESPNRYVVAGNTELAQIADLIDLDAQGRDYSTVAGLLLAQLGHVPAPGEKVEMNGLLFEILEANRRAVLKVRVRLVPPASEASRANVWPRSSQIRLRCCLGSSQRGQEHPRECAGGGKGLHCDAGAADDQEPHPGHCQSARGTGDLHGHAGHPQAPVKAERTHDGVRPPGAPGTRRGGAGHRRRGEIRQGRPIRRGADQRVRAPNHLGAEQD